jgi:hypothetical protein
MIEVEQVVKEMALGKAPVPNGFLADFFHEFWDVIGTELWAMVEDSIASSNILQTLNTTFLALVPKENGANNPNKFR